MPEKKSTTQEPKASTERITLQGEKKVRVVYVGARGGKYVRKDGKFVSLKSLPKKSGKRTTQKAGGFLGFLGCNGDNCSTNPSITRISTPRKVLYQNRFGPIASAKFVFRRVDGKEDVWEEINADDNKTTTLNPTIIDNNIILSMHGVTLHIPKRILSNTITFGIRQQDLIDPTYAYCLDISLGNDEVVQSNLTKIECNNNVYGEGHVSRVLSFTYTYVNGIVAKFIKSYQGINPNPTTLLQRLQNCYTNENFKTQINPFDDKLYGDQEKWDKFFANESQQPQQSKGSPSSSYGREV